MIDIVLATQMKSPGQSVRLRLWSIGALGVLAGAWLITRPSGPSVAIELMAWTQFLLAVVLGGSLTGWRITQLPKTRATEFYLMTPVSDWQIVGGELIAGMLRTAMVVGAALPVATAMWGAGWLDGPQALALIVIPLAAGWLAGVGLAVVAYSPVWLRQLMERIALVLLLAYLVLFGVMAQQFVPKVLQLWVALTNPSQQRVWSDPAATVRYLNPFRLLGTLGKGANEDVGWRVLGILVMLLVLVAIGGWRLVARLRSHYLEENYGNQYRKKEYVRPILDNPLSWWTHRRVSRFRGRINLYLGWTTIGLYSTWMILHSYGVWPPWLGRHLMLVLQHLGGAAMLGCFAVQFALVPVAFLSGLWDSNLQQRLGRLELLLVSPLEPIQFLWGSVSAGWTRGKGFLACAVAVWVAAAVAGRISWWACAGTILVAANYVLLYFSLAFRNLARVGGDRAAAVYGLSMSLGFPITTCAMFAVGLGWLGAWTPLGGIYLASRPVADQVRITGLQPAAFWAVLLTVNLVYFGLSAWLLRSALARFDTEIRIWFSDNLASPAARKKAKREAKQAAAMDVKPAEA